MISYYPDLASAGFPAKVQAVFAAFPESSGLNFAGHTGTDAQLVDEARSILKNRCTLSGAIHWLSQQHTTNILDLDHAVHLINAQAFDGAFTVARHHVCAVLTADCLPVLIADASGDKVAAIHAGWRGLADGILEKAMALFSDSEVSVVIGPSIKQDSFEVGDDVIDAFGGVQGVYTDYFRQGEVKYDLQKWFVDLPGIAVEKLIKLGVSPERILVSDVCTYSSDAWPSYRKNKTASRLAALIWLQ